ncbi:MAG TPA: M28 family peptidase, partial [Pyrinomonadaceae bacterium]|nr:M28 family peptidase [Pyrinomonadaceae bacterium]
TIEPAPRRIPDATAKQRFDPKSASQGQGFGRGTGPISTPKPNALTNAQINEQLDAFLVVNKVALRVNDAAMDHGLIRAFNNRSFGITKVVPTVVMRNEDFGRIARLIAHGTPVNLQFEVRNRLVPEGKTSYNVVAEIPGTDKKDEVVMLGGHLDSWHSATGATDNAVGCAVMMEAAHPEGDRR